MMGKTLAIKTVPAPWNDVAVACKKCGKKLGGGFGPKQDEKLSRAVRTALREAGRRRALRVIETGCLGLCPKGAVAVIRATVPGELLVLPAGTPMDAVLDQLLPPASGTATRSSGD